MYNLISVRVFHLISLIALVLVLGTCGFVLLEGWSIFDGFYMTIITFSTVGYSETRELTPVGRFFTCGLIMMSMVSMAFWTAGITSVLVNGDITGAFLRKKEMRMISRFSGHTIVCGIGVMAQTTIHKLLQQQKQVVLVTNESDEVARLRQLYPKVPIITGDPTNEIVLFDANLLNADYVVAALESDYDNLLIAITCKSMGTDVKVFTCATNADLASRMYKVGADEVICPFQLGGEQIVGMIA